MITLIAEILVPKLRPEYRVAIEKRVYQTSGSDHRPQAQLYPFELQQPIPPLHLPQRHEDTELLVDLQALLHSVYDRAGFDLAIDSTCEPVPPLSEADAVWAKALLQQQGLR